MSHQDKLRELVDRLDSTSEQMIKSGYDEGYNDACNFISDEIEAILNSGDSGESAPVAYTVVDENGKNSIGGWIDYRSFEAIEKFATLRYGHRYAFAYAEPTLPSAGSEK